MVRVENIKLLDNWKRYTLQEMLDKEIILSHLDGNHGELYPNKDEFVVSGVPYLSANCIVDDEIDFARTKFLTQERANTFKKGVAINDDVLFAHNATVGPVAILKTKLDFVVLSTTLTYYRCNKEFLLPNFLRLYMISDYFVNQYIDYFVNQYIEVMRQATRNQVPITKQRTFFHLIPPLSEQQCIVAILDEAFAAIAKAKANAEQNLKNAKELFESYLQGVFSSRNWETKIIEEVCVELFAGGDVPKDNFSKEKNEKYKIPIIANAVKDNGLYGYTDVARVTKSSITIAARGSGTGHTEIRSGAYFPIVRLIVLIPNESLITLEFLKYSIDTLEILRSGSAIPQLTIPMIKEYNLPLPSLKEQQAIVKKLDALSAEIKKLEAIYQKKIEDLEELKKAILEKAFRGELVKGECVII